MGMIKRSRRDTEVRFEGDRPTLLIRGKQSYVVKEVIEQWMCAGRGGVTNDTDVM